MIALKYLAAGAPSVLSPPACKELAESFQAPMDAPFSCCVDMNNELVAQGMLVLRWYKPLATLLAKDFTNAELRKPHCGRARIVGTRGSGTSMFRNYVARSIATTVPRDKPLVLLFQGTGKCAGTIIVAHRPARGTVFSVTCVQVANTAAVGLICDLVKVVDSLGGISYSLVDVGDWNLDSMWTYGATIYFASNSPELDSNWRDRIRPCLYRGDVVETYYVPTNTQAEAEAWFQQRFGIKAEGANLECLRDVMSEYGPTLGVCDMLELAEDGRLVKINRTAREALDAAFRAAVKRMGYVREFVKASMLNLWQVAPEDLCVRPSLFTESDTTFSRGPISWRSNVVRDKLLLAMMDQGRHALQLMVSRMARMGPDWPEPVIESAFLMMFRTSRDRWPVAPLISKSCGRVNKVPRDWWQQFRCGDRVRYFLNGAEEEQFHLIEGQLSAGQPWMLQPHDSAYPGINAVLLSCNGGEKHALLMQIRIASRHEHADALAAPRHTSQPPSSRAAETIAAWCDRVSRRGFKPWLVYGVQPRSTPYPVQAVEGVEVDQLYLTWTTGSARVIAPTSVSEADRVKAVKRKRDADVMDVLVEWVRQWVGAPCA